MNVHICPRVHWNRPPFEMDTGFSAIGVANGYWFPLPFHVCWNEVSGIFFFWVGGGSCCFVRKYECAALCSWSKDHTMIWLQKVAVPNIQFRIARCSALIVRMCCNFDRPIRFHIRLNLPNVCSLRTPESIWTHFCVPNSRGRHPASAIEKILKMSFRTLRSLLNCRSEMHLTTHQTQLLTQQTTRDVSLC